MPRDADEQQKISAAKLALSGLTPKEKLRILRTVPPGAMLHFDGHIMLWLGMEQGEPRILHALHRALPPPGGRPVGGEVLISGLDLCRNDGRNFLQHLSQVCWL